MNGSGLRAGLCAVAVVAAQLLAPGALGAEVRYEGGLSGATGKYIFDARTTTLSLSTGLSWRADRFTARVAIPLVLQNSTLVSGTGAGAMPSGGSLSGAVSDSGRDGMGGRRAVARRNIPTPDTSVPGYSLALGDPVMAATIRIVESDGGAAAVGAAVKAPAADSSEYGTGEWDFGGTASLSRRIGDRFTLGLDASWWKLGDLSDLDFRDPVTGSLSATRLFSTRWGGTLSVTAGTSALRGYAAPVALGAALVHGGESASWGVNLSVGLTETLPDVAVGVIWSVSLGPQGSGL